MVRRLLFSENVVDRLLEFILWSREKEEGCKAKA